MISTQDFCAVFTKVLKDGWGYVPGFDGQVLTQDLLDSKITDENIKRSASKWIGKRVADAGGLFAYALRSMGIADDYASDGSYMQTLFTEFCTETGKLPKGGLMPGMIMFKKRGNGFFGVGLYVGESRIIEAKSMKVGVVNSVMNSEWTYWGKLKNIDYPELPSRMTVRKKNVLDMRVLRGPANVVGNSKPINVRSENSMAAKIIDVLPLGTEVTVVEDCGEFCKIRYVKTGYMKKQFLKEGSSNVVHG